MKRRSIALLLVLSMVIGIFSTVLMYDKNEPLNEVNASTQVTGNIIEDKLVSSGLEAISSGSVGTSANPYDIVEIVPYKGMAQMGYLIGGQEPIDISSISVEMEELNRFTVSGTDSILKFEPELKKKSELVPGVDDPTQWYERTEYKSGYFKKVATGKGQYKQVIGVDTVTRVPIYIPALFDLFQEEESEATRSSTPDEFALLSGDTEKFLNDTYLIKDLSAIKSGSEYEVKEQNVSKTEYIFRYNDSENSMAAGYLTYNPIVFDNLKDFYDAKNVQIEEIIAAGGASDYVCYPTYKKNAEGNLEFTYGDDGEYYVIFVPVLDGTGKYIVDKVRPEIEGKSQINLSLCYFEITKNDYTSILGTTKQYVVDESYVKDIVAEDSGTVTNITYGSSSVLFVRDTEATGVTRYKAVTNDEITAYYENVAASLPADSDYVCKPMYFKHLNYYIYVDTTDFTAEELADLELKYVVFVPDEEGQYVVSSATTDVAGDETKLNLAIAYQSELGFSKVSKNGQYKIRVNDAQYNMVDNGTGNYKWVDATVPDDAVVDHLASEVWVRDRLFYYWCQAGYDNNEVFKKKFLGLNDEKAENFVCKVHVVTPEELFADNSVLDSADLIYMSDNFNDAYLKERVYLWETLGRDNSTSKDFVTKAADNTLSYADATKALKGMNFMANDIDYGSAMKIYNMCAGVDNVYVPIIMDTHIYSQTKAGTSGNYSAYVNSQIKEITPVNSSFASKSFSNKTNAFKLFLLLTLFDDPIIGYNKYINDFNYDENNKVNRGAAYKNSITSTGTGRDKIMKFQHKANVSATDEKSIYWNELTFLGDAEGTTNKDAQKEGYSKSWAYYVANDNTDTLEMVNYNVLTVDGSDGLMVAGLLGSEFKDFLVSNPGAADYPYKVDLEMDEYINDKFSGNFSRANVMKYLLNYEYHSELNDKDVIRILEIEPCKDFLSEKEMITQFREYLPYFQGKIEIEQWLSIEYIGKIDDLNSKFDIVYFGIRNKYLRTINYTSSINDKTMVGLYYYHIGDRLGGTSDTLKFDMKVNGKTNSFPLTTDKVINLRWNGNDITRLNYQELTNYVDANYAVVLEDVIYDCNADSIDNSSNLFKFAEDNKDEPNVFRLSDVAGASQNQLIEFNKYAGWSKLQFDLASESLQPGTTVEKRERTDRKILFKYKIDDYRATEEDKYTVSLYADNNADGSYSESELLAQNTGEKASAFKKSYYTISRDLMDDFCGVVHWALIVQKDSNPAERNIIEGYLEIRTAQAKEKETIRILQINKNSGSTWNLSDALTNKSKGFGKYAEQLEDYKLTIKTMTTAQFEDLYKKEKYDKNTGKGEKLLNNYDMIIYGFGDSVTDIKNTNGAWDNLTLFMDSGKSMLFTHDTTSLYHYDGAMTEATVYLRDRVGMNRFRIPTKAMLLGNFTYPDTYYDKPTHPTNDHQSKAITVTDGIPVYTSLFGYSDWHMARYCGGTDFDVDATYNFESNYSGSDTGRSLATKVNEGQITKYPYVLGDEIGVATTHSQYYALDMEDKDLVVWYCLGSKKDKQFYGVSYNDTRNNYYIYSIRNVMYSGVGHSTVGNQDDEVKLFINTMIAAYNCAIKPPEMIVENEDSRLKTATQDESILYYYSDLGSEDEKKIDEGDTYKVYVNPQDYNLISEILEVTIKDQAGNDVTSSLLFKELDSEGTENNEHEPIIDGKLQLKSGHHYVFEFPLSKLNNNDGIYTYTFTITNAEDISATKEITMGARTLFNVY